jgi:tetratricopeptide (TPR) repeat protein
VSFARWYQPDEAVNMTILLKPVPRPAAKPPSGPGAVDIHNARALHAEGRLTEAEQIYSAILADDPGHFDGLHLLGLLRHQQGREVDALRLIAAALNANPNSPDALSNFGLVFDALQRHQEALALFDKALALKHDHANALNNRAVTLESLGRPDEALAGWADALAVDPNHAEALHGRGNALCKLKRFAEALLDFDRFLAIKPGIPDILNNRGSCLAALGRLDEAIQSYDRALALDPRLPEIHINKGHVLVHLHRFGVALASYADAAAIGPKHAEARFCESLVRLRLGQFQEGWRDYEWRWRQASWGEQRRDFAAPLWLGQEPLAGKTILLHAEQGFGDTLQFVRYVALVARLGATVLLEVQPPLTSLVSRMDGVARVLARGGPLPPFDLHCPLMSLPLAFRTAAGSIPADIPYIPAPVDRMPDWQGRLGEKRCLRIGFAWSGSPVHEHDRARSMRLEQFASLLPIPGIEFVSIQKELGPDDAAILGRHGNVRPIGSALGDFADTAAVISLLDLVVAVDTSVVHLAGALGRPVWALLPFSPDFRWLLEREDSPWYPTARLFRQPRFGDWESVLAHVRDELGRLRDRHVANSHAGGN